jgi:hypothetical protein
MIAAFTGSMIGFSLSDAALGQAVNEQQILVSFYW